MTLEQYKDTESFGLGLIREGPGVSDLRSSYDSSLNLLLGITGLVLFIACANLANLTLARASARERENSSTSSVGRSTHSAAATVAGREYVAGVYRSVPRCGSGHVVEPRVGLVAGYRVRQRAAIHSLSIGECFSSRLG